MVWPLDLKLHCTMVLPGPRVCFVAVALPGSRGTQGVPKSMVTSWDAMGCRRVIGLIGHEVTWQDGVNTDCYS